MTDRTPTEQMAAGYGLGPSPKEQRRRAHTASTFRRNERMEQALKLREQDPAAFSRIADAGLLMSLGYYTRAKQIAQEEGYTGE